MDQRRFLSGAREVVKGWDLYRKYFAEVMRSRSPFGSKAVSARELLRSSPAACGEVAAGVRRPQISVPAVAVVQVPLLSRQDRPLTAQTHRLAGLNLPHVAPPQAFVLRAVAGHSLTQGRDFSRAEGWTGLFFM